MSVLDTLASEKKMNIVALLKLSRLAQYGALALIGGICAFVYGEIAQIPDEAELQTLVAKAEKATKITTKRRRGGESVDFEFIVKGSDATSHTLRIPAAQLTDEQATTALNATQLQIKMDGESDIYVLTADGQEMVTYAQSRIRHQHGNEALVFTGVIGVGGGLLLLLLGWAINRKALQPASMH